MSKAEELIDQYLNVEEPELSEMYNEKETLYVINKNKDREGMPAIVSPTGKESRASVVLEATPSEVTAAFRTGPSVTVLTWDYLFKSQSRVKLSKKHISMMARL